LPTFYFYDVLFLIDWPINKNDSRDMAGHALSAACEYPPLGNKPNIEPIVPRWRRQRSLT
jgi:hypothetical protein